MTANETAAGAPPALRRRIDLRSTSGPPTARVLRWDDARRPLAAYGASLLVVLTTAAVALATAGDVDRGRGPWPRLPGSTSGPFSVLGRGDGAWSGDLARHGYPDPAAFGRDVRLGAFYPVLPALIRATSSLTGLPPVAAGVLIGVAGGAAA